MVRFQKFLCVCVGLACASALWAEGSIEPTRCLTIGSVGRGGRSPIQTDAIQYALTRNEFKSPRPGDTLSLPGGSTKAWKTLDVGKDGWFVSNDFQGGYAFFEVVSSDRQIMMLEAAGQGSSWVNGVIRGGDPYGFDYLKLPIELHAGRNSLLFSVPRGRLRVRLTTPKAAQYISTDDPTLPDLRTGKAEGYWAGIVVVNASHRRLSGASITTSGIGFRRYTRAIPDVPPMSVRKVPIRIETNGETVGQVSVVAHLNSPESSNQSSAAFKLDVKTPSQTYKKTFVSTIDGSVQYYAVVPATDQSKPPALVLTLHGASVEAIGQANAYSAKSWADIVAPTNRRPYGFDWEDWGRLDAMEVLGIAKRELGTDPSRTFLTGHSMGGHGTWQVGVTFPDQFAAMAPSAGWISFFSYAGAPRDKNPSAMQSLFQRAANSSDTLALSRNYLLEKIYILHGDKDDNVPVTEARTMRDHLAKFHPNVQYHEQPGAGHWWGNECVDWGPIFSLFRAEKLRYSPAVDQFEFFTANPAVSARCYWLTIEQQQVPLGFSSVKASRNLSGDVEIETSNVASLSVDRSAVKGSNFIASIDGERLLFVPPPTADRVSLSRVGGHWIQVQAPRSLEKSSLRGGPFKLAFNQRFFFVYGTKGSPEENAWAFDKARYDAEIWYYRGNGSVDVIADTDFDSSRDPDRSVILYGNSTTNSAWADLLSSAPIRVSPDSIAIGDRRWNGSNLACLFLYPRPKSSTALVGVVAGTGLDGMRTAGRLPYFTSGVGYPDFTLLSSESWKVGIDGVLAAGFFDNEWKLSSKDWVVREK